MTADEIRELLNRAPFEPFRFHLTSGDSHQIRDPNRAALAAKQVVVRKDGSD